MSVYIPKLQDMSTARLADGWWVMDKFGPLYGPYQSHSDATEVMHQEAANTGFVGCRHPSYAEG